MQTHERKKLKYTLYTYIDIYTLHEHTHTHKTQPHVRTTKTRYSYDNLFKQSLPSLLKQKPPLRILLQRSQKERKREKERL